MKNIYKPKTFRPVYGLRRPKFLSPTSVNQFYKYPDEFFLQRICANPPEKIPQTVPMGVGSSFDAFAKSWLYEKLIGQSAGTEYDLETMLTAQVEASHSAEHRSFLIDAGRYAFSCYMKSGALQALAMDMGKAIEGSIKMEKTVTRSMRGVPLLGKPDLCFQTACASMDSGNTPKVATFILDWKVNGFMSANTTSPKKGYSVLRDGWDESVGEHSKNHNKAHKDYMHHNVCGINVNGMLNLETVSEEWAAQVVTYAWALGAEVGDEIYCGIDQLCCKQLRDRGVLSASEYEELVIGQSLMPEIRIASFRMGVGVDFQRALMNKYIYLWGLLSLSDDLLMKSFFKHTLSGGETNPELASSNQCEMLINSTVGSTPNDKWLDSMTRAR